MKQMLTAATLATLILGAAPLPRAEAASASKSAAPRSNATQSLREEAIALKVQLALKGDMEALKAQIAALQKELQEIKGLISARPAGGAGNNPQPNNILQNVVLSIDGAPTKGDPKAKIVLIEFSDYQCPFCSRFEKETIPQVVKEYVDAGKVRYVFQNLPLEKIHPNAFKAAVAGHCAAQQGKFWDMHERLFESQNQLGPDALKTHAQAVGLDPTKFSQCMEDPKSMEAVRSDMLDAEKAGITGTPSLLIGKIDPTNPRNVKVTQKLVGAQPYTT